MRRVFITLFFATIIFAVDAQTPKVDARIIPDSIMIGDRFEYIIDVERDLVQVVEFPTFEQTGDGIELVSSEPIDTLEQDGRRLKLRKRFVLTTFDEGNYSMGVARVLYADKNIIDTLSSRDSMFLHVATFEIDSTSQSIYDIKPQMGMPFKFVEMKGYLMWGVILILVLLLILYVVKRILNHYGKSIGDIFKPAPPQPPHVIAIEALESLHNQKLWQNSKYKQYYSSLTDILRMYIVGRYGVGAMEMTADEILNAMKGIEISNKSFMDLTSILQDSNLVKFAKAEPNAEQNESYYLKAYYFVEETKLVEEEELSTEEDGV